MKGWKTVLFNVLAAVAPVLEGSGADIGLDGSALAWYGIGVAIINLILRGLTTTPVFQSGK